MNDPEMTSGFDLVVVGSLNHDITVLTPRLPRPGETVIGSSHFSGPGGKGANQAVAAARLGASVAMIGLVGDDEYGSALVQNLKASGVDTEGVGVDLRSPTGVAMITVDSGGENTIVGVSGANMGLSPEHVVPHADLIADARVVLAQLEVPIETVAATAELANGTFCLNPAPATSLPADLLRHVDVLIPNRTELALLASTREPDSIAEVAAAVERIAVPGTVAVTLGADGALLVEADETTEFTAPSVDAVDTTGAGDAFCGALAFCLSQGWGLPDAVSFAVAAGAVAVGKPGAQDALPTLDQVEALRAN